MPAFQLVTAFVALGNDNNVIVYRGVDEPLTYPEALVLQYVHGESAVRDMKSVGTVERSQPEEKARLGSIYGEDTIALLFPGLGAKLPLSDDLPVDEEGAEFIADHAPEPIEAAPKPARKAKKPPTIEPVPDSLEG